MWWRRSWFSLKGKAGIPGQTEGCPATSIGPRVLPVGSLQQRGLWWPSEGPDMLDEARRWAETQFGTAELGDARRTHRLVSIMAAITRAPDASLPRQLGSLANTKAGYRLFDCGAVTRTAVMDPHVGPACPAVPRRGGAASDRPHGSGRHDPRFLAASHAQ